MFRLLNKSVIQKYWKVILCLVIGLIIGIGISRRLYYKPNLKQQIQVEQKILDNKGKIEKTIQEIEDLEQLKKRHQHDSELVND